MRRLGLAAALGVVAGIILPCSAPAKDPKPAIEHTYGPPPGWTTNRQLAEAAITARLIDPECARIMWLGGYRKDVFKPFLEPRVAGYVACGTGNARNRMGGYAGASTFVAVIDYDRVLCADMGRRSGGMLTANCAQALSAGLFPPVPATATETASGGAASTTTSAATGLTVRAMIAPASVPGVGTSHKALRTPKRPTETMADIGPYLAESPSSLS